MSEVGNLGGESVACYLGIWARAHPLIPSSHTKIWVLEAFGLYCQLSFYGNKDKLCTVATGNFKSKQPWLFY